MNQTQMNQNRNYIAWIPVIELAVLAFTTLGTTITLFLHSDSKTDAFRKECFEAQNEFRKEVLSLHKELIQENKDFHTRLITIEESRRG